MLKYVSKVPGLAYGIHSTAGTIGTFDPVLNWKQIKQPVASLIWLYRDGP